jgi:hypothetical protein
VSELFFLVEAFLVVEVVSDFLVAVSFLVVAAFLVDDFLVVAAVSVFDVLVDVDSFLLAHEVIKPKAARTAMDVIRDFFIRYG